jgi:glycosyltransferase involved in cell wall biosynthesis
MAKISIIVPTFNAEKYLMDTIQSVVAQTFTDWELLIIDDGSNDCTASLVGGFSSDKRIRYYFQPNAGVAAARNHGLRIANGDYLSFLDADDYWFPTNLEKKVAVLADAEIDWVFSDMEVTDEDLRPTGKFETGSDVDMLRHYLLWDRPVAPGPCSNVVAKRKCFENGLCFDERFSTAADQDFAINLSSSYRGKRIAEVLWKYRILRTGMSRNIPVMEKDHIAVYRKAEKNGLFHSYLFKLRCFSNLYFILAGSYWVNSKNRSRSIYFILRSLVTYPPNVLKLFKKLAK